MTETLTMSKKELKRIPILQQVVDETMTLLEASVALGLSERHAFRVLSRFKADGAAGLIHRLRGRHSEHRCSESLRQRVVALYRQTYGDYGPTLFCEKLEKYHDIVLCSETIRRILTADGLWKARTKKHPHRKKRPRREAIGELVQFDGSPHDWFEGRGPKCVLLHAIDDASNRTFLRFAQSENTTDCMRTMRAYIEHYGIPAALYVDFGSVFKDAKRQTQFERAMGDLGVDMIHAYSPQAKGRVERGNQTHQDRLVKDMRQAKIASIDTANAFLEREYLAEHNARFANVADQPDIHRSAEGIDLDLIFCFLDTRIVANDYTIQLHGRYIQLQRSAAPLPPPRTRVIVRRFLDDSLHIYWNEHELAFTHIKERPRKPTAVSRPPAALHAWRTQNQRLRTRIMTPP